MTVGELGPRGGTGAMARMGPGRLTPLLLDVPPVDADGRLLRLTTTPGRHPAVARRTVQLGPAIVLLEVLAASHRVRLRATDAPGWQVHETVACSPDDADAHPVPARPEGLLPRSRRWHHAGWDVHFTAELAMGRRPLAEARRLVDRLAVGPAVGDDTGGRVLVAHFPGHPDALTALTAGLTPTRPDRQSRQETSRTGPTVHWRTWHLYPGADSGRRQAHVVTTRTTARPTVTPEEGR